MPVDNPTDVSALATEAKQDIIDAIVDDLFLMFHHRSYLFPDLSSDIDLTCTFTSGATDEFGTWAEITDSGSTTLSSVIAGQALHIASIQIRATSETDTLYVIELGYGPDASNITVLDAHEFGSGTKHVDSDEQRRFRPLVVPVGQKAYYRMKAQDEASATATIVLRYHYCA